MFRQWLSDWVCSHYGHHWWVNVGTESEEVEAEDGTTTELHIYVVTGYGDCKRPLCTATSKAKPQKEHTLTFHQPVLDSFTYNGEDVTTKFSQKIEQAP
jgi:hypothetical protein